MKAQRIYGPGDVRAEELPSQPVGENCVKIKILKAAVTHSDNLIYEGTRSVKYPVTLGRHCVGMVTEVGEAVKGYARGNKVAVSPIKACRKCSECAAGRFDSCLNKLEYGVGEDGFFRDFAVVGAEDLYKLPERIEDSEAMFLEQIAMAINIVGKLGLEKGEHIAIVGATVTGIILAQVAIYYQAVPVLMDLRRDRLDVASNFGVYYTVDTTESDAHKKIFSLTGGRMAETCAYMAQGIMPLTRTFDFLSNRGRMAICIPDGAKELSADLSVAVKKQLDLFGISGMGKNIPSAINMLANKSVKVAPLISKEVKFDEVPEALKEMGQHPDKYVKVIVNMDS